MDHHRLFVLKTAISLLLILFEPLLNTEAGSIRQNDDTEAVLHVFKETPEKARSLLPPPEVDYNEWTPLGRGDPLKNDPTFDYSPPTLDRVKYWVKPSFRTPDPPVAFFPTEEAPSTVSSQSMTSSSTSSDAKLLHKQSTNKEIKRFFSVNPFKTETAPNVYLYNKYANYYPQRYQQQQPQYNANTIQQQRFPAPVLPPPVIPAPVLPPPVVLSAPVRPPLPMLVPPSSSTLLHRQQQQNNNHSVRNHSESGTESNETNRKKVSQHFQNLSSSSSAINFVTLPQAYNATTTVVPISAEKIVFPSDDGVPATKNDIHLTTDKPSYLHMLLGKEASNVLTTTSTTPPTASTAAAALATPPSLAAAIDLQHLRYKPQQEKSNNKNSLHLIIQGHSKVKKYGRINEKLAVETTRHRNAQQIINRIDKHVVRTTADQEDSRTSRKFKLEDLLPFDEDIIEETFKDIVDEQIEGSGFGATLTKAIFPSELFNRTSAKVGQQEHKNKKVPSKVN